MNSTAIDESAVGARSAAKPPCRARPVTRIPKVGAIPARAEAAAKPPRPTEQRGTPADPVGDAPTDQEQAGERQRVGGDHPLALGVAEAQVVLGGGEGDVDDGGVECGEQLSHRDDAERAPTSGEGGSKRGPGTSGWSVMASSC